MALGAQSLDAPADPKSLEVKALDTSLDLKLKALGQELKLRIGAVP